MESFYVISKEGNGPIYADGEMLGFLYEVYVPCPDIDLDRCHKCHEGTNGGVIEKGLMQIVLGQGKLHEYIEKTLTNGKIRHGSTVRFYLSAKDAFEDVGVKSTQNGVAIAPESALCFKVEEAAFNDVEQYKRYV